MDLATVIGLVLGIGAVMGGMVMEGGNPMSLFVGSPGTELEFAL